MEKLRIKLNGKEIEFEKGKRASEILKEAGVDLTGALVVKVGENLYDMGSPLETGGEMKVITFNDPEGKKVFWHSTSHLMAAAVKNLYPETKVTIGPAIEEGFYYDFDRDKSFNEDDLVKIEEEMRNIIKGNPALKRSVVTKAEALSLFTQMGETYKVELINSINDPTVSLYALDKFTDLCRGPHIGLVKKIKAFKLTKISGAYWHADEKNKMLQRVYGISFPEQKLLDEYFAVLEEAKLRDHRKIGKELDFFSTHEEYGPGLIYWHPKGGLIRKEIEDFWRNEHLKRGYDLLFTPHVAKIDLWVKSGHTGFYKDSMYPSMIMDESEYLVKPMNCPFHILIYQTGMKSYRDLPLRWAELGTVYRYEKSGTLHGLMRVRGFTQDDAHIFLREDQLEEELDRLIEIIQFILKTFGFPGFDVFLSTKPKESIGDPRMWEVAEAALRKTLDKAGLKFEVDEGGGAFYGPKIDIKIKDALNRTWQCSTIQVDFNEPERFDVNYIGKDGKEHRSVMIHRALFGSIERFFGVLIEHYKGAFPVWLSPSQVTVLTITERSSQIAGGIVDKLRMAGIRVKLDDDNEKIGAKIRKAALDKIPYMIVLGDKEVESNTLSIRKRSGEEMKDVKLEDFITMVKAKIESKDLTV
jgi:threonyl-tRNA synthetase